MSLWLKPRVAKPAGGGLQLNSWLAEPQNQDYLASVFSTLKSETERKEAINFTERTDETKKLHPCTLKLLLLGNVNNLGKFGKSSSQCESPIISNGKTHTDENDMEDSAHQDEKYLDEYKRLITIHAGKAKGAIKEWLRVDPNKVHPEKYIEGYPKGQKGYGRSLWLMQGMCKGNGGCAYVKKQDILMKVSSHNEVFDPKRNLPVKKILKVKLYMSEGWYLDFHGAHFDLYSPPEFYAGPLCPGQHSGGGTRIENESSLINWLESGYAIAVAVYSSLWQLQSLIYWIYSHRATGFASPSSLPSAVWSSPSNLVIALLIAVDRIFVAASLLSLSTFL
ncbi:phospholipase C 2 [Actinidia rufa]|uniref:Phospholipase C 2 n=1 Tax=Actinidia rufa TaxID=165716 RepID=A0A7J0EB90_9ERIC|nr:phospholipase C 2 [Actinidia rufa]